jgi:tRNA pseudouridine55 synthase
LVIDKESGPTSFDVVRRIRRALGVRRVGHGGTLDPLATGVLPVCLGEATKLAQFLLDASKEYLATLCFGVETDTYDADGQVTARRSMAGLDRAALEEALGSFRGAIRQIPPIYSALKREGRPLHSYARAGEEVERQPRAVFIQHLSVEHWDGPEAVTLRVGCSKGTYIRALAFDLGRALGPGAHVTALRRTRSGPFTIDRARPTEELLALAAREGVGALPLISPAEALAELPAFQPDREVAVALACGKKVPWDAIGSGAAPASGRFRLLWPDGQLLAVAECQTGSSGDGAQGPLLHTLRVFNPHAIADGDRHGIRTGV